MPAAAAEPVAWDDPPALGVVAVTAEWTGRALKNEAARLTLAMTALDSPLSTAGSGTDLFTMERRKRPSASRAVAAAFAG